MLLEEVERAFGSTHLKIETIDSDSGYWKDSEWFALSGTLNRCQETMTSVEIGDFEISNVTTLKAFRTLLQFCSFNISGRRDCCGSQKRCDDSGVRKSVAVLF